MYTKNLLIPFKSNLRTQFLTISAALLMVFTLFVFMAFLVKNDKNITLVDEVFPVINVAQTPPPSKVFVKDNVKLTPPPQPKPMPRDNLTPEPTEINNGLQYQSKNINIKQLDTHIGTRFIAADSEARPIVRINPKYPINAAREGKEGWVILAFNINEIGGVVGIKIVDSSPKHVFDQAAKQALRKWKYRPKLMKGKAVKQTNLTVQLDFSLDNQQK
jgi:protein TonB